MFQRLAKVACVAAIVTGCHMARPVVTASVLSVPAVIPFELRGDYILVHVKVNGQPTVLGLDTGSSVSVLDSIFASQAGLSMRGGRVAVSGAKNLTVRLGVARTLDVGTAQLANVLMASTTALEDVRSRIGHDVHGTLGFDLFDKYVVAIDYTANTLTLYDAKSFSYSGHGIVLPVRLPNRAPILDALIVTRRSGTIPARLTLDLGSSNYALRLSTPFVTAHDLEHDTVTVAGPFGVGLGGLSEGRLLRMPELRLGDLTIDRPSTGLYRGTDGAMGSKALTDGTIGVPVWERTRLILDYARSRVILEPRGRMDVADAVDASGLTLLMEERPIRLMRVGYVIDGSAGGRAGVRVGDELVRIDQQSVSDLTYEQVRNLLRATGTTCQLTLHRGERTLVVSIALRSVI